MIRKQILENAIRTVCQDRKDRYGEVENNFKLIADLWSAYLGAAVSAVDVAMMMGHAQNGADQNRKVYAG